MLEKPLPIASEILCTVAIGIARRWTFHSTTPIAYGLVGPDRRVDATGLDTGYSDSVVAAPASLHGNTASAGNPSGPCHCYSCQSLILPWGPSYLWALSLLQSS